MKTMSHTPYELADNGDSVDLFVPVPGRPGCRMLLVSANKNMEYPEALQAIVTACNSYDRLSSLESYFLEAQASYDKVKAENERLREALEYIITECGFINAGISNTTNILIKARAALANE